MEVVGPTHEGPPLVQGREETKSLAIGSKVTASSERSPNRRAGFVTDANYATLWMPDESEKAAWLQIDLGAERSFSRQIIRPEYAWKSYRFKVEVSGDGEQWETLADFGESPATGSPIRIDKPATARFLRLAFPDDVEGKDVGIFEWAVME